MVVACSGAAVFYWQGLESLGIAWQRPEYSYGPLVPLITAYLTLHELKRRPPGAASGGRSLGWAVFGLGIAVGFLGHLTQIPDVITYGFILFVGSVILIVAGSREGVRFWPAWLHLVFMLPLPQFIYLAISTKLQVVSSVLGVYFIRLADVPVFLDGNIIDLGIYKLQVAEACSGLAYLFPLLSFGWLMAVLYRGANWHRVVLLVSTVPITILMNSFRIGVVGILVNLFGIAQAEGFLHFFEGWIIFIACIVILYVEAWILWRFFRLGSERSGSVLELDIDGQLFRPVAKFLEVEASRHFIAVAGLILSLGVAWHLQPVRDVPNVTRLPLGLFPMQVGDWTGTSSSLDRNVERVLGADDYLVANYAGDGQVSLLLTFYKSQTEGSGIHSPEVCLPSGGWEVSQWEQVRGPASAESVFGEGTPVNRAVIQNGLDRQLVYYWFEGRGRQTANDYEAKFLSMLDTITDGRSDGGLVRLITPIDREGGVAEASRRLDRFMKELIPLLPQFFPPLEN